MKQETLYDTFDLAIAEAKKNTPNTVRVASACDGTCLSNQGYNEAGQITFRIYRTFNAQYKQKYMIRYCYTD